MDLDIYGYIYKGIKAKDLFHVKIFIFFISPICLPIYFLSLFYAMPRKRFDTVHFG
jgi:hypothetical protein